MNRKAGLSIAGMLSKERLGYGDLDNFIKHNVIYKSIWPFVLPEWLLSAHAGINGHHPAEPLCSIE